MVAVLTVTDNGNGTAHIDVVANGVNWAVSTAPAESVNTRDHTEQPTLLQLGATDTNWNESLPDGGHWFFIFQEFSPNPVLPAYTRVTSSTPPMFMKILTEIADQIKLLGLAGIDNSRVVTLKTPMLHAVPKVLTEAIEQRLLDRSPGVLITPMLERRRENEQYNTIMKTDYRCRVSLFRGAEQDPSANLSTELKWRSQVTNQFHLERLPIPGVEQCWVEPGDLYPFEGGITADLDLLGVVVSVKACEVV